MAPEASGNGSLDAILEITRLVLQRNDLEADSNFFDAGGTSLAALHIVWKIEERFGVELPLESFFDAPDLRAIANEVDAADAPTG